VAAVFEFAGAALLGASVTKTIRSGILNMDVYENQQEVLAFGMLVALVNASFWLILATAYGLPVSTTHTIIAAIVGFSIAANGWESIMWGSLSKIFISWVAAPAVSTRYRYSCIPDNHIAVDDNEFVFGITAYDINGRIEYLLTFTSHLILVILFHHRL
jgi:phosphate/sulfate permease